MNEHIQRYKLTIAEGDDDMGHKRNIQATEKIDLVPKEREQTWHPSDARELMINRGCCLVMPTA